MDQESSSASCESYDELESVSVDGIRNLQVVLKDVKAWIPVQGTFDCYTGSYHGTIVAWDNKSFILKMEGDLHTLESYQHADCYVSGTLIISRNKITSDMKYTLECSLCATPAVRVLYNPREHEVLKIALRAAMRVERCLDLACLMLKRYKKIQPGREIHINKLFSKLASYLASDDIDPHMEYHGEKRKRGVNNDLDEEGELESEEVGPRVKRLKGRSYMRQEDERKRLKYEEMKREIEDFCSYIEQIAENMGLDIGGGKENV